MGMQTAHSPVEHGIQGLNLLVTVIIVAITVFVAGLLAYVSWRYSAKRNPVAGKLSHHSTLEVAWTAIPVLILVVIAIPSFRLVYFEDRTHDADLTVKVTGHQWYWEYTYPDAKGMHFDSYMVNDAGPEAWTAAPSGGGQSAGGSGRQEHPHPDDQLRT